MARKKDHKPELDRLADRIEDFGTYLKGQSDREHEFMLQVSQDHSAPNKRSFIQLMADGFLVIFPALFLAMLVVGVSMFYIGFHNADLAHDVRQVAEMGGKNPDTLLECNISGCMSLIQTYEVGIWQQRLGLQVALVGAFCLPVSGWLAMQAWTRLKGCGE